MVQLHVFLFPMMARGHMIPTLDMAKLFSSHGVKTTLITTPLRAPTFTKAIEATRQLQGNEIAIRVIEFPVEKAGLPEGCESLDKITDDQIPNFIKATFMLQEPLEQLLKEYHDHPSCLVADMFFPWATEVAEKFCIPRLIFHGTSYFALCVSENMRKFKPFKNVSNDSEPFLVPNLPHQIMLTRNKVPLYDQDDIETDVTKLMRQIKESENKSFGVIINSFYELEPEYSEYYRKNLERRSWHIGPLHLCNGRLNLNSSMIDEHQSLKWLEPKKQNSVIFVCFGSISNFTADQLREIAIGLEASGQEFIWVVRKTEDEKECDHQNWLPEGFEERMKDRGLIIRGWAPQVKILENTAVGSFITHCGWNSTLEAVCAGKPMVTWPLFAEQFFNEKLVTEILRIGVGVGSKKWSRTTSEVVKSEEIAKAVMEVMVGEEATELRDRALVLMEMAMKAVEDGGSSSSDLRALIEELSNPT
ncbi:hypothetical protein ACH5RR_022202 [Cinchona calisaya]|uniref:Glycosyltransferase n=1 Tax=Cinchona calisaya TaxID=153742 RepID=A0ABD2Z762_9GENT